MGKALKRCGAPQMTEDRARKFFQQIIAAVEYCHNSDIVHRDLKLRKVRVLDCCIANGRLRD